jgi:outer membrane assembly lipoprotein YfiO
MFSPLFKRACILARADRVDSPGGLGYPQKPLKNQQVTHPIPNGSRASRRLFRHLVLGVLLAWGCASAPPEEEVPSAETYYKRGLEILEGRRVLFFFRDVDHARAVELFQEVIDNYPYSQFATLAELKIADTHFEQGNFEEAASYYQDFVELHPNHPEIPYAILRNGLCAFEQIGGVSQDQTSTAEAISQFRVLIERYPDSKEAKEANARLQTAVDKLADHEIEVGLFYYRRGDYHAATRRFREAMVKYPEHTDRLHTMVRLGNSLKHMGHLEEAEEVFQQVLAIRTDTGAGSDWEDELEELGAGFSDQTETR